MRTTAADRIEDFTKRGWWGEETLASMFDQAAAACPGYARIEELLEANSPGARRGD